MKDMKACIFNIQKYSIHDGPGIRTVVFFKGCPLQCSWCSNPESQNSNVQITWDKSKCIKCLHCLDACKYDSISLKEERITLDAHSCTSCFECIKGCPKQALTIEGKYYPVFEVLKEALKDEVFYEESGGGVTLSGGEVLQQHAFAIELLKQLKDKNIHTACETTGYAPNKIFKEFIENVDLLLFDIKHYDREKHFKGTSVYNDKIIANLATAIFKGKDVIIRIPVIPNFNNSLEDAQGFCDLLKTIGAKKVNLLPFHQFGQEKYELINKQYALHNVTQLHEEDLIDYRQVFIQNGLDCTF